MALPMLAEAPSLPTVENVALANKVRETTREAKVQGPVQRVRFPALSIQEKIKTLRSRFQARVDEGSSENPFRHRVHVNDAKDNVSQHQRGQGADRKTEDEGQDSRAQQSTVWGT